jgi:2,3-bisphosphoglycerate-dependent phosphoglycerate mutase
MNDVCTFYIVRHGETDWNVQHKLQGQTDIPLNKTGEAQAKELAEDLQDIHFDKVFSSDLLRAKKTAEIVVLEKKLAVETAKVLRERRFGELEGKHSDIFKKMDLLLEKLEQKERAEYKFNPSYESDEELWQRLTIFLRETAVAHAGKTVLVVAHGGLLRALVDRLVGKYNPKRLFPNGAYLILECDGVEFNIKEAKGIEL